MGALEPKVRHMPIYYPWHAECCSSEHRKLLLQLPKIHCVAYGNSWCVPSYKRDSYRNNTRKI